MNSTEKQSSILLVDDDPFFLKAADIFLDKKDFLSDKAASAKEALGFLKKNEYDLVLSDIIMPKMDGIELLKAIKTDYPEIDVVFMTAYADIETAVEAIQLGAYDFILKPVNFDELQTRIEKAIEKSRLKKTVQEQNKKLEELSQTDELTGVPNRRFFNEALRREWGRAHRNNTTLSFLMIDIDHFKLYNDRYGHQDGDRCLQAVARSIAKSAKRATDVVARYGGEEFSVILPDTPLTGALTVANQIRQFLSEEKIPHEGSPVDRNVTISIGIATTLVNMLDAQDRFVKAADDLLFRAKRNGRNRIESAEVDLKKSSP